MHFRPIRYKTHIKVNSLHLLAFCLPIALTPLPSSAFITLLVEQIGPDVVITGSGMANLRGLGFIADSTTWTNIIADSQVYAGSAAFGDGNVSLYGGITGSSAFGIDATLYEVPDMVGSSGDLL